MGLKKSTTAIIAVASPGDAAAQHAPSRWVSRRVSASAAAIPFDPEHTLVYVTPRTYRRVWVAVVFAHLLCAAFVAFFGIVYLYLRNCIIINSINVYDIAIDMKYFPHVAAMYFALAGIHISLVSSILVRSIRARAFLLRSATPDTPLPSDQPGCPKPAHQRSIQRIKEATSRALLHTSAMAPQPIARGAGQVWKVLVACRGAMSVRSKDYGLFFLLRELWQTSLQTYQAYRLSGLLPRLWMNNGIIALLVFNCWSTPLIKYIFPADEGKLRLSCVLISFSLDFVSHAAIPIALLLPYARQFNYNKGDFDLEFWYTDVWFAEAINEIQLLFVTSFWDAVSKFVIATSVARWLDTITKLLRVSPSNSTIKPPAHHAESHSAASVAPSGMQSTETHPKATSEPVSWKTRVENGGQRILVVWGIVVLVAHLHAASLPVYPQCLLRTRPWFGSKLSCSLLAFDCSQEQSTGSAHEFDAFLHTFDESRIEFLVIGKCPLLQFPSRFNTLNQLLGMKLFRSTVLNWGADVALTSKHHPKFLSIFFVDVNVTEFPQGLLSPDFPPKFMDIEFVRSNLTRLPDDLDLHWPKGMFLIMERCQFQEVPSVISRMEPRYLSLAQNNISVVSRGFLDTVSPVMMFFAGNPIESLPSNLAHTPEVDWLSVVSTQISFLPDWIDESYLAGAIVEAGGTPLCDRMISMGLASAADELAQMGIPGLDCSTGRIKSGAYGWYPAGEEEDRNPSYIKTK